MTAVHADVEDRYRRTLDHLRVGFQIIDFAWRYVYLNPVAAQHGRSTPDALTGRLVREAYPGIDQTPLWAFMERAMTERSSHVMENEFEFPDGQRRWFDIRVEPVPEGICVYSFDIHDRRQAQLALERRNAELERGFPWFRRLLRAVRGRRAVNME